MLSIFTPYTIILSCLAVFIAPPISNLLNFYDNIKNKKFIKLASKKSKSSTTKIIAITGSNGKTSVKNILLKILSSKYKVLATPESFNTPIGIAKFINNSNLENVDFLILEYGARQKGDIKFLCKTFGADYGIITSIAPQHLETFKNIDNIKKTKNELAEFLNLKPCVFNLNNQYCRELYSKKMGKKIGVTLNNNSAVSATNINIKNCQTHFKLNITNNVYLVKTNLLGECNVVNILLATSLSIFLNIEIENIIKSIENLEPVPHRLELIKTHINILDDTYNCSIASTKEAINVLNSFPNKKMIATPGIIEAGTEQKQINFHLGELCANCDFVIIIGNHNKAELYNGLKSKKVSDKKIRFANTLDEAKQYFHLLSSGDTLLLLNDLPDEYS